MLEIRVATRGIVMARDSVNLRLDCKLISEYSCRRHLPCKVDANISFSQRIFE